MWDFDCTGCHDWWTRVLVKAMSCFCCELSVHAHCNRERALSCLGGCPGVEVWIPPFVTPSSPLSVLSTLLMMECLISGTNHLESAYRVEKWADAVCYLGIHIFKGLTFNPSVNKRFTLSGP
ncbi:hypothetical protein CDAR_83121 [Caerostris darwini]|uniref:Phorbol-ester/DAG-type domain-containing protein n=1 Tax=Caerostris darwini TaxID=1538125 RepID=A0AAV4NW51_9ARAC|nr:hypothetical protein CDAR_83121 [Caerostris darwini]